MWIVVEHFLLSIEPIIVYNDGLPVSHRSTIAFSFFHIILVMIGATSGVTVAGSTSDPGSWSYQFSSPTAIAFDPQGFMYVLDFSNDRVQKWWPGAPFGTTVAATALGSPRGMQFDRLGNIVIADTTAHRVISFGLQCRKCRTFSRV